MRTLSLLIFVCFSAQAFAAKTELPSFKAMYAICDLGKGQAYDSVSVKLDKVDYEENGLTYYYYAGSFKEVVQSIPKSQTENDVEPIEVRITVYYRPFSMTTGTLELIGEANSMIFTTGATYGDFNVTNLSERKVTVTEFPSLDIAGRHSQDKRSIEGTDHINEWNSNSLKFLCKAVESDPNGTNAHLVPMNYEN